MFNFSSIDDPININLFKFYNDIHKEDFKKYEIKMDELYNKKKNFYLIFDLLEVGNVNLGLVFKQAKYMMERTELNKKFLVGSVILVKSTVVKGIINMIFSIKKPVSPNLVTDSFQSGLEYLTQL